MTRLKETSEHAIAMKLLVMNLNTGPGLFCPIFARASLILVMSGELVV